MKKILVVLCILATIIVPGIVWAWDAEFHVQMVKDAVALCPTELRAFLKNNMDAVILGAANPDITITSPTGYAYGYRDHYYIPEQDKGSAPDQVKNLSLSTIDLIAKQYPDNQLIAMRIGMVSHYVADSIEPRRYIGLAPDYPRDFIKEQFRNKETAYLPVIYNGYNPIIDFSGDIKTLARSLWNNKLTDEQYYDMAVNEIVDVWTTIWEKAGKPSGNLLATGSKIRPVIPRPTTAAETVFAPSDVLDLKSLGEPGTAETTYDESTFDIEKYAKDKAATEPATAETPLEKKSPEEIENATGTPPPPGTNNQSEETPGGTTGETPAEKTGPPSP